MLDISIVKPERVEHVEARRRRATYLFNDRQAALVERIASRYVLARRGAAFRAALASKLAGPCGDAAVRRAAVLAAIEVGASRRRLERDGLLTRTDMERHRLVKKEDDDNG